MPPVRLTIHRLLDFDVRLVAQDNGDRLPNSRILVDVLLGVVIALAILMLMG